MAANRKPKGDADGISGPVELTEPARQPAEVTEPAVVVPEGPPEVPLADQVDHDVIDPGPIQPGFVRIYHHETGGVGEVPADVVPFHAARGWTTDPNPPTDPESQED
jgi:hypothetical protein